MFLLGWTFLVIHSYIGFKDSSITIEHRKMFVSAVARNLVLATTTGCEQHRFQILIGKIVNEYNGSFLLNLSKYLFLNENQEYLKRHFTLCFI